MPQNNDQKKKKVRSCWYFGGGACFVVIMTVIALILCFRGYSTTKLANNELTLTKLHPMVVSRKLQPVQVSKEQWQADGLTTRGFNALERVEVQNLLDIVAVVSQSAWSLDNWPLKFRMASPCTKRDFRRFLASSLGTASSLLSSWTIQPCFVAFCSSLRFIKAAASPTNNLFRGELNS